MVTRKYNQFKLRIQKLISNRFFFFFLNKFLEANLKPADLSERVIFKARSKSKPEISEATLKNLDKTSDCEKKEKSVKHKKIKESKSKLSFNDEEEEEDF